MMSSTGRLWVVIGSREGCERRPGWDWRRPGWEWRRPGWERRRPRWEWTRPPLHPLVPLSSLTLVAVIWLFDKAAVRTSRTIFSSLLSLSRKLHRQSYATARLRPCGVATSFAHCTSYEYNLSRVAYDSSAFRKARTTTNTTPKSRRHAKIKPKNHMTPRLPGCGRRHLLYSNRRRLQDCKHRSGARKWGPERAPAFATYLPSHLLQKTFGILNEIFLEHVLLLEIGLLRGRQSLQLTHSSKHVLNFAGGVFCCRARHGDYLASLYKLCGLRLPNLLLQPFRLLKWGPERATASATDLSSHLFQ